MSICCSYLGFRPLVVVVVRVWLHQQLVSLWVLTTAAAILTFMLSATCFVLGFMGVSR